MAWFVAEQAVLLAALHMSAREQLDRRTWQLCWAIGTFLDRRGQWHDVLRAYAASLVAAQRLGDPRRQASVHKALGRAHTRLGHYTQARRQFQEAIDGLIGDERGTAHVYLELTRVAELESDFREALSHSQAALDLYRSAMDLLGQARALNNVGWHMAQLGDLDQALTHCEQALAVHRNLNNRHGEANTLDSLGYIYQSLDDHRQAIRCYERALGLFGDLDDRYYQAQVLIHLGDAHSSTHNAADARDAWQRALTILEDLGQPADQVRARLYAQITG